MQLRESLTLAVAALRANKLRSFLTLLGNIVGVMSVIAIVAVIQGMNHYVASKIADQGSNVFWIDKFGMIFNEDDFLDALKRKDLTKEDAQAIAELCPSVAVVGMQFESFQQARFRGHSNASQIQGMSEQYPELGHVDLESGRHLTLTDMQHRASVCVLGQEVADKLFDHVDPIGKEIRVADYGYTVVGVAARKGKILGQSQDNNVIIPYTAFQKQFGRRASPVFAVKAAAPELYAKAQDEARVVLRARRHVPFLKKDDFGIITADMVTDLFGKFAGGAFIVMVGVAGLALVVGGIVIMNIMLVSVTERTREIGIRKAVGARGGDILQQFLYEAVVLSLVGGLIGVLVGAGIAVLVRSVTPLPASIEPWSVLAGLLVASSVGLFFGIYPAMRASRLDPIVALRYE